MKLYQSVGPNPRVATMYIAERGLNIPRSFMDIMAGENRNLEMLAKNPSAGSPFLELDDGAVLADSVAICQYLEETQGVSPLLGESTEARAAVRALLRRIDFEVVGPLVNGFRSAEGLPIFESRMFCCPEAADGNKAYTQAGFTMMESLLGDGPFLLGDDYTLADILLFCFVEFGAQVGQPLPEECIKLAAWRARIAERESAKISADPNNGL